jgi:hypothetical protein
MSSPTIIRSRAIVEMEVAIEELKSIKSGMVRARSSGWISAHQFIVCFFFCVPSQRTYEQRSGVLFLCDKKELIARKTGTLFALSMYLQLVCLLHFFEQLNWKRCAKLMSMFPSDPPGSPHCRCTYNISLI